MYRDGDGATAPIQDLNVICTQIPVHIILGTIPDLVYESPVISSDRRLSCPLVFQTAVDWRRTYGSELRPQVCLCDPDPEYRPPGMQRAHRSRYAMMLKTT